ncbi:DUF3500 domain-containing protein [Gulosibacter molinativorax]|uniref:DUF3500 domain-containing protein n=1 Tax=Gulosibacter molinativorax TaxID=256821 RepID=UPI001FE176DD|nr:DUF3500 domain-containing protein [Gulosibacter molinativorax]QUY62691.1 Beta-glucosidase [Gulosibacter molinativorax]
MPNNTRLNNAEPNGAEPTGADPTGPEPTSASPASAPANDIDEFFSTDRTRGTGEAIALPDSDYREFVYDLDDPVVRPYRAMDYEEFTEDRQQAEFLRNLLEYWDGLYREPFVGITSDGHRRDGLYRLPSPAGTDAAEPNASAPVAAAISLLDALPPVERAAVTYALDAPEWRGWSNPEFVFKRIGLRLEELADEQAELVYGLLRESLSAEGYERVREAMALNGFLGEITKLPQIMNDRSYWFAIYGKPSTTEPWGWQLFGRHVALNFVFVGGREVCAPVFIGAEPALSEPEHPPIFERRERLALELAATFTPEQRDQAVVYTSVLDEKMPDDRIHPADERHVAGAFRDNRIVPYEGILATEFDHDQRELLREIVRDFYGLLRPEQVELTLAEYDEHIGETYLAWYGATDGSTPSYLRIQSPVIIAELDHHAGVWLSNRTPARFHVHSTLRHPNGNDYGKALISAWQEAIAD